MGKRRRKQGAKKAGKSKEQRLKPPSKKLTPEVVARIQAWSEEAAIANDVVLFDQMTTAGWVIRLFIDRPGVVEPGSGVTVEQCVAVSRQVEMELDADVDVPENYRIEVSSPGVESELTKWRQFPLVLGRTVKLVLIESIDGQNVLEGVLEGAADEVISVTVGDQEFTVPWPSVKKAQLTYKF